MGQRRPHQPASPCAGDRWCSATAFVRRRRDQIAALNVERDVNDLGCAAIPLADATPQRLAERDIGLYRERTEARIADDHEAAYDPHRNRHEAVGRGRSPCDREIVMRSWSV